MSRIGQSERPTFPHLLMTDFEDLSQDRSRSTTRAGPGAATLAVLVVFDAEWHNVWQRRTPDPLAEATQRADGDGEASDVADDRDGAAGVGIGDRGQRGGDAVAARMHVRCSDVWTVTGSFTAWAGSPLT